MAIEQQASADGNWNPAIFEYAKVKSVDPGTGIITFWDRIQYNYARPIRSSNLSRSPLPGLPMGRQR